MVDGATVVGRDPAFIQPVDPRVVYTIINDVTFTTSSFMQSRDGRLGMLGQFGSDLSHLTQFPKWVSLARASMVKTVTSVFKCMIY